jgi:hypothetical protein
MLVPSPARPRVPAFVLFVLMSVCAAIVAAPAQAAAPITALYAGPIEASSACSADGAGAVPATQGSRRTDFCMAYAVSNPSGPAGDDMQQLIVDTPRGYSGNPDGSPQCTNAQFNYASQTSNVSCPANSQVGDVRTNIRVNTALLGTQTLANVPGRVYNLEHTGNEVARLGIILDPTFIVAQPKVKILVRVTFRPAPDLGLRSIIDELPRTACTNELLTSGCGRALATDAFALRFWGSRADHPSMPVSFGMLGSDCSTDQTTTLRSVAYDGATSGATGAYQLTDCASAPFAPSVQYTTTERRPDVTTETTVAVKFGVFDDPRVSAGPRRTVVTLPEGLSFSGQIASGAAGLPLCTAGQFGRTRPEHHGCPAAAAIGTVRFSSPVLAQPLVGNAYLGTQPAPGELPQIFIEAQLGAADDAPRVKLVGQLSVDARHRVVTTLDDLPQQPVSEFSLTFRGGDHAALVTPPTCGTFTGALAAYSYAAQAAPVRSETPYRVADDCDAVTGFAPSLSFVGANPNAAQAGAFATTVSRPDRSQRITRAVVNLPPGELANLKGVPECSPADAAANTCPANTQVGTITSLAGVGPAPYRAAGQIYLTSRPDDAVAGVVLRVPVTFGDVNLGDLSVPARIEIRDSDLGLRFVADVPERFKGIPLNIRSLTVALDRQGFAQNPTSCAPLTTTSVLTGSAGATADVTAQYQVAGCDAVPFAPTFDASVSGQTQHTGRPNVQVRIDNPAGNGAMRQTTVTLPAGIGVDLAQLSRACPQDTFASGGCPSTARIGTVAGTLSIADERLGGTLYLLKPRAGKVLPGLGMQFTGRFAGRVAGSNAVDSKTGQLVTQFDAVPDLPLTSLQIDIAGGAGGPVVATTELCAADAVVFAATFASHSGQTVSRTATTSCGAPLAANGPRLSGRISGMRSGRPIVRVSGWSPTGKSIARVELTVPKGWVLASRRGRPGARYAKVSRLSGPGRARIRPVSARVVRLTMPPGGSTSLRLLTRTGTVTIPRRVDRRTTAKVSFSAKVTTTDGQVYAAALRLTPR